MAFNIEKRKYIDSLNKMVFWHHSCFNHAFLCEIFTKYLEKLCYKLNVKLKMFSRLIVISLHNLFYLLFRYFNGYQQFYLKHLMYLRTILL